MDVHEVHLIIQEYLGGRLVTSQPVSKEQSQALWIQVNYEPLMPWRVFRTQTHRSENTGAMNTALCQHQCAQRHIPEQQMAQSTEGERQTEHGTQEREFSICVFIYFKKKKDNTC